jgi:hypothetical protein
MANEPEPEVIRRQMEAQRAALSDKLETLENRIVETVEGAREAVAETVDSVKIGVKDSVETVKDTVQTSVHAVQETFDLPRQVERHPWAMFGGAVALGFAAGYIVNRSGTSACSSALSTGTVAAPPAPTTGRRPLPSTYEVPAQRAPAVAEESWATHVTKLFGPELHKLKGMAVGALMGVVREMIADPLPEPMRPQVKDVVDSITTKLGGEPVTTEAVEPLLPKRQHAEHHNGHHRDDYGDTFDDDRRVVGR